MDIKFEKLTDSRPHNGSCTKHFGRKISRAFLWKAVEGSPQAEFRFVPGTAFAHMYVVSFIFICKSWEIWCLEQRVLSIVKVTLVSEIPLLVPRYRWQNVDDICQ